MCYLYLTRRFPREDSFGIKDRTDWKEGPMFNQFAIPPIIAFFVNGSLGLYVLRQNPKRKPNRVYALFMLTFIIWHFNAALLRLGTPYPTFSAKFVWAAVFFMLPLFLHFSLVFPRERRIQKDRLFLFLMYFPSLIFLPSLSTDLFIKGSREAYWGTTVAMGRIAPMFAIVLLVYIVLPYFNFFTSYRESKTRIEREQIKYVITGTMIFLGISIFTNYVFLIFEVNFPPIGDIASIFMSGFIGYAIVKYKLLSVEPVVDCDLVMALESGPKYDVKRSRVYLVGKDQSEKGLEIFVDAVGQCSEGLCIANKSPRNIRDEYSLSKTPIISFSPGGGGDWVDPTRLDEIGLLIDRFIEKARDGIVLLDDLDFLIEKNSQEDVMILIENVNYSVSQTNSALVISFDSNKLSEPALSRLGQIITTTYSEVLINMLSHPIRRGIIVLLADAKEARFTSLMDTSNVKNSQILTFHINKLKEFNLIEQNPNGKYRLSEDGELAVKILGSLHDSLLGELTFK